jgi:pyridoxal 5'-phosphate synthase pdxT subunit
MRAVGVLALQGDSGPHRAAFARLGVEAREVRRTEDLEGLTHLVLPGGESTTLHHLMALFGLWEPVRERARAGSLALFGTCAGTILLGRAPRDAEPGPPRPPRMALLDAEVRRNAYGRQVDSRVRELRLAAFGADFPCVFIRAPRIESTGAQVRVLADDGETPILVEAGGVLAATFHPELTEDPRVHAYFLERFDGAHVVRSRRTAGGQNAV